MLSEENKKEEVDVDVVEPAAEQSVPEVVVESESESEIEPVADVSVSAPASVPAPAEPARVESVVTEKIVYKTDPNIVQKLLVKARAVIQQRKRTKLNKIITLFEANSQITNTDVQKLLRVSSATAVRYLDILENENRITQVGNTGKAVFYTKI